MQIVLASWCSIHITKSSVWHVLCLLQVVLAYLMALERTSVQSALTSLRHVYPYASPNAGVETLQE